MAVLYWKPCYNEVHYNEVGLYLFFLFLLQNIDCGYSLKLPRRELPRRGSSNMYPQSMF